MTVRVSARESVRRTNAFAGACLAPTRPWPARPTRSPAIVNSAVVISYSCTAIRTSMATGLISRTSVSRGCPTTAAASHVDDAVFRSLVPCVAAVRPGARAAVCDGCALRMLQESGLGSTHAWYRPRCCSRRWAEFPPDSTGLDTCSKRHTFNIEPAIYIKEYGGIRHCDVVTVHHDGADVLTPFQIEVNGSSFRSNFRLSCICL